MKGIYIHIPFCVSKCSYCNFYSISPTTADLDRYCERLCEEMQNSPSSQGFSADTLYIGGGTPSVLSAERIGKIINCARNKFGLHNAEITFEANPKDCTEEFAIKLKKTGVNRLSLGIQSAKDNELKILGRRHTASEAKNAFFNARRAGFDNISLDLMLGIPEQTAESLSESLAFFAQLDPEHISTYILKIEDNTPFSRNHERYSFPDDDTSVDFYKTTQEFLTAKGYRNYEISNFAKQGRESLHNNIYWNCDEYLGFGPSAHSFCDGNRFFYRNDLASFLKADPPVFDSTGGDKEEYCMLRLRLKEGILFKRFKERFGEDFPESAKKAAKLLENHGLMTVNENSISITLDGFAVSNGIILKIIESL